MWRRLVSVPFRFRVERHRCFLSTESDTLTAEEQKKVAEKLTNFFKNAEESIAKQQAETEIHLSSTKSDHSTASPDRPDEDGSSDLLEKKSLNKKQHPTAVSFVPWTMSCFLQEMNIRKLPARRNPNAEQSFATLLRNSPFIQLGDFESREVIGVVIENVNETDLYIDFGGKFHCVCPQPSEQHYPRGSLVRLRLRDPEMTNKFMINTKGISLCEADATLLGPYRGRVVRNPTNEELTVPTVYGDSRSAPRPATENDSESATDYSSGDAVQKASDYPPNFNEYVLKSTQQLPVGVSTTVKGYDFNNGLDYEALLNSFASIGFQATQFGRAVDVINMMLDKRVEQPASLEQRRQAAVYTESHPLRRMSNNCTVFLSYTSNMVSCGVRDIIRFIVQYNMVDVLVTSAGGIEEDLIKCMAPSYIGDFERWPGAHLRELGVNRIGNILVPNDNYVAFEEWLMPLLDDMLKEQETEGCNWTPSKMIDRLGKEINHPDSIYYWCHVNKIPVFCPGLTDGSIGDILFSHTYRSPGLRIDIVEDIRRINSIAIHSRHSGVIILGGGIIKHHTLNANLMRNGADYCVLINTGQEFDGSDSGARPDEAMSWGKLKSASEPVKVHADASLIFPLLVAQTFAKRHHSMTPTSALNGIA
ncbi:Deoxyhypusine synthase [Paragonimus heterotremus]|uniref:deoxyhypusine synthase n=1 Tax=Paragonimus heterotremus TaxID=100268 RepID=A0A8J4WND6_9TREM|nr:Deoxyhypusine synthase [Paragonimus heterotremus]